MRGATIARRFMEVHDLFQSTLLMRGATSAFSQIASRLSISIHAPHARSDEAEWQEMAKDPISIHAPHARSDQDDRLLDESLEISIHAPHARSDLIRHRCILFTLIFQSTLLMRGATEMWQSTSESLRISIHAPHARSDCLYRDAVE